MEYFTLNNGYKMPSLTDEEMAEIAKVDKNTRYYNATPELVASYKTMELKEDI